MFVGFDGYGKATDCLKPHDVAILTTPPAFRWVHFRYAIQKGINVFMEKPISVDGPSTRRVLALANESLDRNLKVGVGLMCRHCVARQELFDRIQMGQMGDINLLRAYRLHGPVPDRVGPPDGGDPQGQALQRGAPRRSRRGFLRHERRSRLRLDWQQESAKAPRSGRLRRNESYFPAMLRIA